MSLDAIRTAIVATMNTVTNVGIVHDYERYAKLEAEFKALYVAQIAGKGQVRGWYVRRLATREVSQVIGRYQVTHEWLVRGFMAIEDAAGSEKVFDTLIESVRDVFRTDETLGGVVSSTVTRDAAGLQLEESVPVLFAGVLCHSARLKLITTHDQ